MDIPLLLQMPIAAIAAILLYTFIGFIPGTDETSVLVPVTLALVRAGVHPIVILTFFIAAIVTLDLTNAIPTALVGLPGGVLSTPMMEHALYLKSQGRAAETIKKWNEFLQQVTGFTSKERRNRLQKKAKEGKL